MLSEVSAKGSSRDKQAGRPAMSSLDQLVPCEVGATFT